MYHNLTCAQIREHEDKYNEGQRTSKGVFCVDTRPWTGRSPQDRYIVRHPSSSSSIDWGEVNQPCSPAVFEAWHRRALAHLAGHAERLYVFDGFCGARPDSARKIRIITQQAWQHHFARNMFIPSSVPLDPRAWDPDFTIINASGATHPNHVQDDLHSECFVGLNIEARLGVIGGTGYAGEMKKGLFSMMNYWLPGEGILPMHCAANVGRSDNKVALFFGLSGTGKTTLSTSPTRALIGDDEHGWDQDGVFNMEGGCYAKTARLNPDDEPEIYKAIRSGALLENVTLCPQTSMPLYDNTERTENGRVSYPLAHISNHISTSQAGHPRYIFFLTCDATGVLPPVARLDADQAMFHFLCGYTAKVAGTERGVETPTSTFSAGFGAAFLPRHPSVYARLLQAKLQEHGAQVYLINTGWTGGGVGTGHRMAIDVTRACIDAVLAGAVDAAPMVVDPIFGFDVPCHVPGVSMDILQPRRTWLHGEAYDQAAHQLRTAMEDHYSRIGGITGHTAPR